MRFRMLVLVAALAGAVFTVGASAQRPVKEPYEMERLEFPAGQVCEFPILIDPIESESSWTIKSFKNDRMLVTGTGTTRLTNLATGTSTTFRESGSIWITPLEGGYRFEFAGQFGLYFFDGDEPAGAGMFLAVGRVNEVLMGDDVVVTFFELNGQQTDLCAQVSG